MHIEPSSLKSSEEGTSNLISTLLLMIIFAGMVLSAVSFAVPMLGRAVAVADMQRAEDVLSALDANIRTNTQGTMEYRLFTGYLSGEKERIDLRINYSANNSIYMDMNFSSCTLYYLQSEEYPSPSISYPPEMSLQSGGTLHLAISEIEHDFVPYPGYHKIRFSSSRENSSHTGDGNFSVHINDHHYNRSRYYSNITTVDLNIKRISIWDEEWRG